MNEKRASEWLRINARKYRLRIVALITIEMIISMAGVGYALAMKLIVDRAAMGNGRGFALGVIVFSVLVTAQFALRFVSRQMSESVRCSIENHLKMRLLSALLHKEYEQVSRVHSEEWMNRMTSDTAVCAGGMTDILPEIAGMLVRLFGSAILIYCLEPRLAFIIVPCAGILLLVTLILRKSLKNFHKYVQEADGRVRVCLQEIISSTLVVRTFGMEDKISKVAADVMREHSKARMQRTFVSNVCNSGFSLSLSFMYLIGIVFCGYGIFKGTVSFGTLTAVIQLVGQMQSPLSGLSGCIPRYFAVTASAERLMEAEAYSERKEEGGNSHEKVRRLYEEKFSKITVDKLSFSYRNGLSVLENVSFSIEKGDFVTITGSSGCGKSTLLKVLMGIYQPQGGRVAFLMNDGEEKSLYESQCMFSYVPQGNFLMSGTIRDVISFGDRHKNEDRIKAALYFACADFVNELPERLDTVLGEKGAGLSEGQIQRIAIARALYADRPVLILDESTGALDCDTECSLLERLKKLTDKTVLIVTHRPNVSDICNRQIVFTEHGVLEKETGQMYE